jgi:hypothetical protein
VMLFYDRIVLIEWSAYDFDGDTELETAIRRSVLVRLPKRRDGVDPSLLMLGGLVTLSEAKGAMLDMAPFTAFRVTTNPRKRSCRRPST